MGSVRWCSFGTLWYFQSLSGADGTWGSITTRKQFSKNLHISTQSRLSEQKLLVTWLKGWLNGKHDLEISDFVLSQSYLLTFQVRDFLLFFLDTIYILKPESVSFFLERCGRIAAYMCSGFHNLEVPVCRWYCQYCITLGAWETSTKTAFTSFLSFLIRINRYRYKNITNSYGDSSELKCLQNTKLWNEDKFNSANLDGQWWMIIEDHLQCKYLWYIHCTLGIGWE